MARSVARRLSALLGLAAVWFVLSGAPVLAHAVLLRAEPAGGTALPQAPAEVHLRFNEPVEAAFTPVAVYNRQGVRVDRGNARIDPTDHRYLTVGLPELPAGFYTVTYRVTSADGHPVQGAYGFTVGAAQPAAAPLPLPAAGPQLLPPVGTVHGAAQAAAVGLAGLAAFAALVWRPVSQAAAAGGEALPRFARFAGVLMALLAGFGLADLALYAVRASGEPFSLALLEQALWRTRVGRLWLVRLGCGLLTAAAMARAAHRRHPGSWWGAAGLGGSLLFTLSLQSHVAAAGNWPAVAADWVHLLAAAVWTGGLLGFVLALSGPGAAAGGRAELIRMAVARFSPLAIAAVPVLAATGLYATWLHVPDMAGLTGTAYGRALLVKLGLLVPLLAVGGVNLIRRGQGPFRRLVTGELLLAAGVLVAAGFLTSLPPARADRLAPRGPFMATQTADGLQISLQVEPYQVGYNAAVITVQTAGGAPVTGASVGLRVNMLEHDMGLQNPDATEVGEGRYRVGEVVLGMNGTWHVQVVVLTRQGQEVRIPFTLELKDPTQM